MKRSSAAVFLSLFVLFAPSVRACEEQSLEYGGRTRTYLVHFPPQYDNFKQFPLVIVLHGAIGNSYQIRGITKMTYRSAEEGFIAVFPDGTGDMEKKEFRWNGGNCCGDAKLQEVDDVGFIRVLIQRLKKQYRIDPDRVYAAGFSNGGILAYRLGCELSGELAAVAVVSGALGVPDCRPGSPVSFIIFHGTADTKVLYDGGVSSDDVEQNYDKPVSYAVDFWTGHDHLPKEPLTETRGSVTRDFYSNGDRDPEVVLYTLRGGEHEWPGEGGTGRPFAEIRNTYDRLSATDEIWDFFKRHPKTR